MANITQTSVSPGTPQFWLALAIGYLRSNLMMARLVRRDADALVAERGDTVNVIKRGALTVRDKAEDTGVTPDAAANTKVAVVLDQHKYVSWHLEDTASAKAIDDAVNYVSDAAAGLAEAVESSLLGLYTTIANDVGTGATDIGYSTILAARKQLNDQKCPMMGRQLIVSSKDEISLLDEARLVEADKRGDSGEVLREANIGRVAGFDIYMSQLVDQTAGPVFHNMAFHGDAFMLVSRTLPMPEAGSGAIGEVMVDPETGIAMRYIRQWDGDELKTKHILDVLYGVKEIDEDRLAVEVLS